MTTKKKDHLDKLIEEFVGGDPKRQAMLDEETVNFGSAQLVYQLRTKAGLTQRRLARKVGTTASVICRMEQADYDGSLAMLRRITGALNQRLEGSITSRTRVGGSPANLRCWPVPWKVKPKSQDPGVE